MPEGRWRDVFDRLFYDNDLHDNSFVMLRRFDIPRVLF